MGVAALLQFTEKAVCVLIGFMYSGSPGTLCVRVATLRPCKALGPPYRTKNVLYIAHLPYHLSEASDLISLLGRLCATESCGQMSCRKDRCQERRSKEEEGSKEKEGKVKRIGRHPMEKVAPPCYSRVTMGLVL